MKKPKEGVGMKIEKDIERYLTKKVEKLGGQSLKWVCPGNSGVPDRIIILPGGLLYFVELKRPKGGTVEKLQKLWGQHLAHKGQIVFIIKNKAEVDAFIDMLEDTSELDVKLFKYGGFFEFDSDCDLVKANVKF